jgi:hypothetical protein
MHYLVSINIMSSESFQRSILIFITFTVINHCSRIANSKLFYSVRIEKEQLGNVLVIVQDNGLFIRGGITDNDYFDNLDD